MRGQSEPSSPFSITVPFCLPIFFFFCTFQASMTWAFLSVTLNVSSLSKEGAFGFCVHPLPISPGARCRYLRDLKSSGTSYINYRGIQMWPMCLQGTSTQDEGRESVRTTGELAFSLRWEQLRYSVSSVRREWFGWDFLSHFEFFKCGYKFNNILELKKIQKNKNILGTRVVTLTGRSKFVTHLPCKIHNVLEVIVSESLILFF